MNLIDLDAAIYSIDNKDIKTVGQKIIVDTVVEWLESLPVVDAVPVVKCNECRHQLQTWVADKRMKNKGYMVFRCSLNGDQFVSHAVDGDPDDYCSKGEKIDGSDGGGK